MCWLTSQPVSNNTISINSDGLAGTPEFFRHDRRALDDRRQPCHRHGNISTLGNDFTGNASSTSATISGNLGLGGADRDFTIADGSAADDLVISGIISGARKLRKEGAGTMVLSVATLSAMTWKLTRASCWAENNSALGDGQGARCQRLALQLQGGITIGIPLTVNGSGVAGDGALRNLSETTPSPVRSFSRSTPPFNPMPGG